MSATSSKNRSAHAGGPIPPAAGPSRAHPGPLASHGRAEAEAGHAARRQHHAGTAPAASANLDDGGLSRGRGAREHNDISAGSPSAGAGGAAGTEGGREAAVSLRAHGGALGARKARRGRPGCPGRLLGDRLHGVHVHNGLHLWAEARWASPATRLWPGRRWLSDSICRSTSKRSAPRTRRPSSPSPFRRSSCSTGTRSRPVVPRAALPAGRCLGRRRQSPLASRPPTTSSRHRSHRSIGKKSTPRRFNPAPHALAT